MSAAVVCLCPSNTEVKSTTAITINNCPQYCLLSIPSLTSVEGILQTNATFCNALHIYPTMKTFTEMNSVLVDLCLYEVTDKYNIY